VQTKFAAYLHWRETGFRDGAYDEAFATTAVLASDGGMLVARAVDGTLNEGHYVSPGGLIDARDVGRDGLLDPAGAALRELAEETGLSQPIATRRPGYLLARDAPYLAIASVFDVAATSDELLARVEEFIASQDEPELLEPMIVRGRRDLDRLPLTTPARLIGAHLLD
jgi:8-oxo-dGTP pyrophosphatase MutT (NUDIX family)